MLVLTDVDSERIAEQRRRDEFFWLDVESPSNEQLDALRAALDLHPMALEDTREFRQRPKVDPYRDYVLVVFYTAQICDEPDRVVSPAEVHVYVSGHWIVTVHRAPLPELEGMHDRLESTWTEDEDYLVYRIFDALTDAFFPAIMRLEERIDELEAEVLERPRREHLRRVYRTKQEVHELQRLIAGQRDQFHVASGAILELAALSRTTREYLRDIGDHLAQIASEYQRQIEDLLSLTQTYFNANSDRLNAVATRITIGGTIFVLYTVVTGFFGQNFGWLVNNIDTKHDFLLFGVSSLVVPTVVLLTLFWVKRDDWF